MSGLSQLYADKVTALMQEVASANEGELSRAGAAVAQSLGRDGGMLHVFGSGHSAIVALELVGRAGGLVPVNAIPDPTGGWAETLPGYGERLFERYTESYEVAAGEVVIVVSNSGRNCSPVEVALAAKERGARVVAITSVAMSRSSTSKHASGQRLFELADFLLDNFGVPGDALMDAPGGAGRTAPSSTLTGALLMEMLLLETLEELHRLGADLPILRSANTEEGPAHNARLFQRFRARLRQPI